MKSALTPYATAGIALVGAGVVAVTPVAPASSAQALAVQLTSGETVGIVIGGSGTPIPGPDYVEAANNLYIDNPDHPIYPGTTYPGVLANGLFTPEGLYPLDGIKVLTFNYPSDASGFPAQSTSEGQGLTILNDNVQTQLADGNTVTVFGYSQSAGIASLEMEKLVDEGDAGKPVQFLLIGDVNAPNGGILERFNGFETLSGQSHVLPLNLASLGFSFDGATPANDFHTSIYSLEYDGFTDFPRYPLNVLSDLNAFLGIRSIHGTYLNQGFDPVHSGGPTPEQIAQAQLLPGSMDSPTDPCSDCLTNYYMIPTGTPPLVQLLSGIPVVGKPLADLLGPDLTMLINLGYGNPDFGWSTAPANVPTPFGLFPNVSMSTLFGDLAAGTKAGLSAFEADLVAPTSLSSALPAVLDTATVTADPVSLTDIVNAFSGALSSAYAPLLGTADLVNALLTSLPAYDASLFTTNVAHGDLLDAVGLPLAVTSAMDVLAAGFELQIIANGISDVQSAFAGL